MSSNTLYFITTMPRRLTIPLISAILIATASSQTALQKDSVRSMTPGSHLIHHTLGLSSQAQVKTVITTTPEGISRTDITANGLNASWKSDTANHELIANIEGTNLIIQDMLGRWKVRQELDQNGCPHLEVRTGMEPETTTFECSANGKIISETTTMQTTTMQAARTPTISTTSSVWHNNMVIHTTRTSEGQNMQQERSREELGIDGRLISLIDLKQERQCSYTDDLHNNWISRTCTIIPLSASRRGKAYQQTSTRQITYWEKP